MKKYLILLFVLSLLLCSCGKTENPETVPPTEADEIIQDVTQDLPQDVTGPEAEMDPEDITEPVVTETVTRLTRTSVLNEKGEEILYREYFYDEFGRQSEYWEYTDGDVTSFSTTVWLSDMRCETVSHFGENTSTVLCDYDEQGNLLRQEYPEDGRCTDYTYDEFGNVLTVVTGDGSAFRYEYTYDEGGRILVQMEYLGENPVGRLEKEYDEQGREVATAYFYPDGSVNYTTVTTYAGDTETRTSFRADGTAYLTQITVTDAQGNILSRETWQGDVMVSRTENTYEEIEMIAQ